MSYLPREFEAFEAETDVFNLRIDGVPVWERIRVNVYHKLLERQGIERTQQAADGGLQTYIRGLKLFLKNAVKRNPFLSPAADVIFVGHPRRKQESDGLWWDTYCDPIHEACELDAVQFEKDHNFDHLTPPKTSGLRYLDLIEYGGTLQRKLGIRDFTLTDNDRDRIVDLERQLERRFDATVDITTLVEYKLGERRAKHWLYRRLFERVDPDVLLMVASYGKETIIEAAQSLEIPVAELQHGIIHPNHFGYSFRGERTKVTFPDYLLTFGPFWTEDIELPIPDSRVFPVGYPYLDQRVKKYSDVETRRQLLFISQRPVGKRLTELALSLAADPDITHDIVYKLHPSEYSEWRGRYPALVDEDVRVVDSDEPPLYRLFAESEAQIGWDSTALFEGLRFDLQTYIYADELNEQMRYLTEEGGAVCVSSVGEIREHLQQTGSDTQESSELFSEYTANERCSVIEQIKKQ